MGNGIPEKREDGHIKIFDSTGREVECMQSDTIQRIFELWKEIQPVLESLKQFVDQKTITNGYTSKEISDLEEEIKVQKKDKADKEELKLLREDLKDVANKYDRMFWLLVAFFILFIVKTFVWKI